MQTSPLMQHLIDLNGDASAPDTGAGVLAPFGATHSALRIAAADAAGFERGRQSTDAERAAVLSDMEARHARELAAARQQWSEAEASRIATHLEHGMAGMRTELAAAMVRALIPFIADRLRNQAVEDMVAAAEDLVADAMPLTIEVSGPADLAAVLARRLEPFGTVVRTAGASDAELRVRADARILETRIKDWLALVEGALV